MGGGHTVAIGFPNTKLFSHLVVMSAGAGQTPEQTYADFFKNPDTVNKQLKLLWVSVGKDDFALAGQQGARRGPHQEQHQAHVRRHRRPPRVGDLAARAAPSRAADVPISQAERADGQGSR